MSSRITMAKIPLSPEEHSMATEVVREIAASDVLALVVNRQVREIVVLDPILHECLPNLLG